MTTVSQYYFNILPWDIITEKRPNEHRNSSACCPPIANACRGN
jgi:hypothetical protein